MQYVRIGQATLKRGGYGERGVVRAVVGVVHRGDLFDQSIGHVRVPERRAVPLVTAVDGTEKACGDQHETTAAPIVCGQP
ncbi:hypothetical protein D2E90_10780 [Mycobacteroides abscessus]|nr:hypothetical protein [Mycobacteroides abscessus]RIT64995.1 hypothetical protein D2E90_10780 [Mycobacteroides abscessus]